ncbi:MAG: aspartate racemase [Arenicella sp.]|jgi:aspartate racemase
MVNFDLAEIEKMQQLGDWAATTEILIQVACRQQALTALSSVPIQMHKVADQTAPEVLMLLLHIADATTEVLKLDGLSHVGLL